MSILVGFALGLITGIMISGFVVLMRINSDPDILPEKFKKPKFKRKPIVNDDNKAFMKEHRNDILGG